MNGLIDVSQLNIPPERHELETAKFFSAMGKNVIFLKPSSIPNTHTPDIIMDGLEWEMKCPKGCAKSTIEDNIKKAVKQSRYVIFDLRLTKLSEKDCIVKLEKEFIARKNLKKLYVITKDGFLLKYQKNN